ncbi:MAG: hypothetical protein OEM52_09680, partial [bacterium]|nr:hypothetical protein [bacterium]
LQGVVLDSRIRNFNAPWFYLGEAWAKDKYLVEVKNGEDFALASENITTQHRRVDYLIVYHRTDREQRVKQWEAVLGQLSPMDTIPPAIGDRIRNFLNPKYNQANDAVIYRVTTHPHNP